MLKTRIAPPLLAALAWSCVWTCTWIYAWPSAAASDPPPLRVGSDAVDLEADDSMVIAGGIGPGGSDGQEGKLRCVATVIEGPGPGGAGRARIAIVACDILMMRRDRLDEAARKIESELRIPFENVLISTTHTHHAPTTVRIHGYDRDERFCGRVTEGIVEATRRAAKRLEDDAAGSRLLFRLGEESSVGQNSRLLLSDGTVYWVGDRKDAVRPTGPFDPELPVVAFRREGGGLEAVLFNHSTHCIGSVTPGNRSPGFYGMAAQELEAKLGCKVTFISGAFGSTHNLEVAPPEMVHRIREAVNEALSKATPREVAEVRSLKREFGYRVRKFDEAAEDAAIVAYMKRRTGGSDYTVDVFRRMRRELAPLQGESRTTWIQALRIGDIAVVALPGEVFTKLGIEVKRRSPFRHTFIAGVSNDYIGYIPDERAFDLGGYQLWTGFHSHLERGAGEAMVDAAVAMLEELHAGPRPAREDKP